MCQCFLTRRSLEAAPRLLPKSQPSPREPLPPPGTLIPNSSQLSCCSRGQVTVPQRDRTCFHLSPGFIFMLLAGGENPPPSLAAPLAQSITRGRAGMQPATGPAPQKPHPQEHPAELLAGRGEGKPLPLAQQSSTSLISSHLTLSCPPSTAARFGDLRHRAAGRRWAQGDGEQHSCCAELSAAWRRLLFCHPLLQLTLWFLAQAPGREAKAAPRSQESQGRAARLLLARRGTKKQRWAEPAVSFQSPVQVLLY